MSQERFEAEPERKLLAELSALADGSLEPHRAHELRNLIAASPELGERYQRERRAVRALQSLSADRAPSSLRFVIDAKRHRTARRQGRFLYGGVLAAAVAGVVALVVLLLPGGSPGAPSISQAAALAFRGAAFAAPPVRGERLKAAVDDVYFPNWGRLHWHAVGQRVDHVGGKLAMTVYYQRDQSEIAYTILAAPPLSRPRTPTLHLYGIELQSFAFRGRPVVTWRKSGHTCILSGSGVPKAEFARLAGWTLAEPNS